MHLPPKPVRLPRFPHRRSIVAAAACLGMSTAWAAGGVVISQLYGAGGNAANSPFRNDFVELFNAGSAPASLSGWSLQYASATGTGNFAGNAPLALPGLTLQPGQYLLISLASGGSNGAALPTADASSTGINLSVSGGKVALVSSTAGLACNGGSTPCSAQQQASIIDLVGYGGANFYEAAAAPATSNTTALLRNGNGCTDSNHNANDFTLAAPAPRNTATPTAACGATPVNEPIVLSCPALNLVAGQGGSVTLSASDADSRVNGAAIVSAAVSGLALGPFTAAANEGDVARVAVQAEATLAAGAYSVQVRFVNDDAQSATCTVPVTVTSAPAVTRIFEIQGSGLSSPLDGQTVTTQGVVTAVLPGLSGFTLQDETGDGNPLTSDGVFVYAPGGTSVKVGDRIRLKAGVTEFNTVTELTNPTELTVLGSGAAPGPTLLHLPVADLNELERCEGMLVEVASPMTVSQNYFQGRYGQVTLSSGGRLFIPTNVHRPGSPEALALADENARRSLVLDDGASVQNPNPIPFIAQDNTLRAGDGATHLVGIIDHGLITASSAGPRAYKLQATQAPVFTRDNPRTPAPQDVGGNVKLASFNVLNYFTTIDQAGASCAPSGTRDDCRGADSATELARQRAKIVAALAAINADAVGLMEMQNSGNAAVNDLVNALNAQLGAGTYAAVPLPTGGGTGTDAIRVAMIYKPQRLTLQGAPVSDANPVHNRPPLLARFAAANGETLGLVVNHFKSKGCDGAAGADLDQGDGQGCFNDRRVHQAQALADFLQQQQAQGAPAALVLMGDFNAYAKEDPIAALVERGFTDLIGRYISQGYSYVFDGAAGYLDHALASSAFNTRATGAVEWHINADEPSVLDYNTEFKPQDLYTPTPYRSSDHDPVVIGVKLVKTIQGTAGRDTLTGTPGDDELIGGEAADVLTGGAGRDTFTYRSLRDAADTVTDFTPGEDKVDLSALLASLQATPVQARQQGVVRVVDTGNGAAIQVDPDGSQGPAVPRTLLTLRGLSASQIDLARDLGL